MSSTDCFSGGNISSDQVPIIAGISRPHHEPTHFHVRQVLPDEWESVKASWQSLEDHALVRNAFFEYTYLVPALIHLADDSVKLFVISAAGGEIVGVVPCQEKKIYGLPLKGIEVWKHDQCFDTTPLLHADCAVQAWEAFCRFLISNKYAMLSLDTASAEPAFESILFAAERTMRMSRFQRDTFARAALRTSASAEEYIRENCSKNTRKSTRRMGRRLAELGDVCIEVSGTDSDWQYLTDEFLRLEACGWKGENATALLSNPQTEAFYRDIIKRAADRGKARFVTLKLDGKPIAMLSDIRSGDTIYSYKSAFDETYGRYSPGMQCEFQNIDFLHDEKINIADSCTSPDNPIFSRIWGQKIAFQSVVFGLRNAVPKTIVRVLPSVQSAVRKFRS